MLKILIADDEKIVLNGLKHIVPWEELGISVCTTASDGQEALTKILEYQPEIVLIDISMPTFSGLEVIKMARNSNFKGHFIILSGYTKFEYAQQAMNYGVNYYLTKPVDSDKLLSILKKITNKELIHQQNRTNIQLLKQNQRSVILKNLMNNPAFISSEMSHSLHLENGPFQIVIYYQEKVDNLEKKESFEKLLMVNNSNFDFYEEISFDHYSVILLKNRALQLFKSYNYSHTNYFFACGSIVDSINDLQDSYMEAKTIFLKRFFLPSNKRIAYYSDLPLNETPREKTNFSIIQSKIINCILLKKNLEIEETLFLLKEDLITSALPIKEIRYSLIDFYLTISNQISYKYPDTQIPLLDNPQIIFYINTKTQLDDIIDLLTQQFLLMSEHVGITSNQTIIDSVTFYIQQNYQENLTLEQLSDLFNYNSSYLGKLFKKSVGINFNQYLDQVRIKQAKKLLKEPSIKIYEVATQVGFKNVDYFYKKFKAIEHESPAKYRKQILLGDSFN